MIKAYFSDSWQLQSLEFVGNKFGFGSGSGFIFSKQKLKE